MQISHEDVENKLFRTFDDHHKHYWTKYDIRHLQVSKETLEDCLGSTTNRLYVPSDRNLSFKLTKKNFVEEVSRTSIRDECREEEEVGSGPSIMEDEIPLPSSTSVLLSTPPRKPSVLSLNDDQKVQFQCFLRLGLDLENSGLIRLIECDDPVIPHFDWVCIIWHNKWVKIPPAIQSLTYPRDGTNKNSSELTEAVRRYIAQVLALKQSKGTSVSMKRIEKMKMYRVPALTELSEPKETVAFEQPKPDHSVKGYRNKENNTNYYNACTQTDKFSDYKKKDNTSRDTQTPVFPLQEKATISSRSYSTQVEREDHFVDERTDRVICSRLFISAKTPFYKKLMAERIQLMWRKYAIRMSDKNVKEVLKKLEENVAKMGTYNTMDTDVIRQLHAMLAPSYMNQKDDAYMLYVFLDNWWQKLKDNTKHRQALNTIRTSDSNSTCNSLEKGRARKFLLDEFKKFMKCLFKIEHLIMREPRKSFREKYLKESAKPIDVNVNGGQSFSFETLESQRGALLKHFYKQLKRRDFNTEERIDFLLHLEHIMLQEKKQLILTERILQLVHKEIDYLNNSIPGYKLKSLRQRIDFDFLRYITSPDVNPNIQKILDKECPMDSGPELKHCDHCLKVKPTKSLQTEGFSNNLLSICKECHYVYVTGSQPTDHSKYTTMVFLMRQEELKRCTLSPVPFLVNESTTHFLVSIIWQGHSPISNSTDLSKLRLVRWIVHLDWTPWNNIILTEEEAECHMNVKQVHNFYSASFVDIVSRRNKRAWMCFEGLVKVEYQKKLNFWFKDKQQRYDDAPFEEEQEAEQSEHCQ